MKTSLTNVTMEKFVYRIHGEKIDVVRTTDRVKHQVSCLGGRIVKIRYEKDLGEVELEVPKDRAVKLAKILG